MCLFAKGWTHRIPFFLAWIELFVLICHLHCAAPLQIWYIFSVQWISSLLDSSIYPVQLQTIYAMVPWKKTQQKKIYFICLFIYVCTFGVCVLCVLAFHINNGIRFIKAKKYGPIKLLYTVSNYSCMHIIHVINYLRIYKEQLFCRKIGDTCHAQYTTPYTHCSKRMACGSVHSRYIHTVHVLYNDGKFSPVPILWQFVYGAFFTFWIFVSLSLTHSCSWFWI